MTHQFRKIVALCSAGALLWISCENPANSSPDGGSGSGQRPEGSENQPEADITNIDRGRLIGFWDFTSDGTNAVADQAGDWKVRNAAFQNGSVRYAPLGDAGIDFGENNNHVVVDHSDWNELRGVNRFGYFSGAIRFRASDVEDNGLLTFGRLHRFMYFEIVGGRIWVTLKPKSGEIRVLKSTRVVNVDTWYTLYFRVTEFAPNSESDDNNIYIQLDNQTEERFNYRSPFFEELYTLDNFDRVMGFENLSTGKRFTGECDWALLTNGGMTPGNAQHYLERYK